MEQKIINLYQQGYSISKIKEIVNISYNQISKILKKNNIEVIDRQIIEFNNKFKVALQLYKSGYSLTQISNQIHIDRHKLAKKLKSLGINVENKQNITKFNETQFDSIDTEEKAYWLGFLMADGNLSSTCNNIELGLKESDKKHLEKYLQFLNFTDQNKIKYHKGKLGNSYRVVITNKHMWNRLNQLGCVPKKSLILTFPKEVINYKLDFIRGYFDEDGCLSYIRNLKSVSPNCSMISTKEFLLEIQSILKNYDVDSKIVSDKRYKGNTKILKFSVKNSKKLLKILYSNASIYLDRKYNRYLFFKKEFCRSSKELDELLANEIGESCDANPEVN